MSTIGMMEGAFFVGRKEILDWINSTLDLNLGKIEDTASGAVACQLLDIMYPGQVPMHKVNWSAKQDFEYVANYKVLQTCFAKLNIDRFVDVDRLISGKYMDNLEFMQWYKRFFEMNVHDKGDYDAVSQRAKGKGGAQYGGTGAKKPVSAPAASRTSTAPKSAAAPPAAPKVASSSTVPPAAPVAKSKAHSSANNQENAAPNNLRSASGNIDKTISNAEAEKQAAEIEALKHALEESQRAHLELKQDFEGLEKERDFYFEKLRDVEILMQELEDKGESNDTTAAVFKILYATAEGFEQTTDDSANHTHSNIPATPHKGHLAPAEGETF